MKLFECQQCGNLLYFENTLCARCGYRLGYLPEATTLTTLTIDGDSRWRPMATPDQKSRFCANAVHDVCNWLIPDESPETFCQACRLNRTIPDLSQPEHRLSWQRLEAAKHRMVYGLLRLGLPVRSKTEDPDGGLAFNFLADAEPVFQESGKVMTGHAEGLITINIAEADDAEREKQRTQMAEPYRTILGHFRHEVGHYYWERLIRDTVWLEPYRALFGDENADYGEALQQHYAEGPPGGWRDRFVSSYASAHSWEDWAETWAHILHIIDTLETAHAFGMRMQPTAGRDPDLAATVDVDPYPEASFDALIRPWLPLTYAVNSLNRSMGQPDLYPFVLAPAVLGKLRFVHHVIRAATN